MTAPPKATTASTTAVTGHEIAISDPARGTVVSSHAANNPVSTITTGLNVSNVATSEAA